MGSLRFRRGKAYPLGASRQEGINFAVFSDEATRVVLEVRKEGWVERFELTPHLHQTGHVWHGEIFGIEPPFAYVYFVENPALPHSFELPLVDPYAKALTGLEQWGYPHPEVAAWYQEVEFDWGEDHPPAHTSSKSIIYELHLRGFTKDVGAGVDSPGTCEGLVEKIPYLKELGVTAVEIMPIHEFDETDNPFKNPQTGEDLLNYWGYASINFFAPKAAYAHDPWESRGVNSFKTLVKKLHEADLEVILDVVFNHTAEGGEGGRIFNFKALSKEVYYLFDEDGDYANYSGCGNTLNCNHPVVRKMVLDALVYWVVEMRVDGFRFDLASILSRDEEGRVLPNPPLLEAIAKHPVLSGSKIIAEAWDAQGLYQVGAFPAAHRRWAEWNGRFRDQARLFARGDSQLTSEVATRLAGSEDLYKHSQRNPFHSINFITSHDGFTLMDLVSYETKHNKANGEANQDGTNENYSANYGVEGPTADLAVLQLRKRQIRNFAALLILSQGTPMILAGDEFGNSQQGNNNTWCQDNRLGWINWSQKETHTEILTFWQKLITFRKSQRAFAKKEFYQGVPDPVSGLPDLSWHGEKAGQPLFDQPSRHIAFLIDGMRAGEVIGSCIFVVFNFEEEERWFELPKVKSEHPWVLVLETFDPGLFLAGQKVELDARQARLGVPAFSMKLLTRDY